MFNRFFLLTAVALFSLKCPAADSMFHKQALITISQYFGSKLELENVLSKNAEKYLNISLDLFKSTEPYTDELIPKAVFSLVNYMPLPSKIVYDRVEIVHFSDGTLIVNGKYQRAEVINLDELKIALKNNHWLAVRNCLLNIAFLAQKVLISSGDERLLNLARKLVTDNTVPLDMRIRLLSAF